MEEKYLNTYSDLGQYVQFLTQNRNKKIQIFHYNMKAHEPQLGHIYTKNINFK